jgi:hypothetical protein
MVRFAYSFTMGWMGKNKYEVEAELLGRVDQCRATWEYLHGKLREAGDLTAAAAGTSDGALAAKQAVSHARLLNQAQENYVAALHDFSHFIISGTLPDA